MIQIPWHDLPTFDWRSVISAALGAAIMWLQGLFKKPTK